MLSINRDMRADYHHILPGTASPNVRSHMSVPGTFKPLYTPCPAPAIRTTHLPGPSVDDSLTHLTGRPSQAILSAISATFNIHAFY